MIEVKDISKSFDGNHVLKNITVEFLPGKVNFIIGRSGSGKSVLTKCIVGLMEVDKGEIVFDGRSFTKWIVGTADRCAKKWECSFKEALYSIR
jgi:phospholipid/cholesterol/gamma-HCH transport system ATP-binding protein